MKQPAKKSSRARNTQGQRTANSGRKRLPGQEGEAEASRQKGSENMQKTKNRTKRRPAETATANGGEPIEILLVEDNEYDARRTMNALKTGKVRNRISWVGDGVEAMEFVRRQGV